MSGRNLFRDLRDAHRQGIAHLHLWRPLVALLGHLGKAHLLLFYRMDITRPLEPCRASVPIQIRIATAPDLSAINSLEPDDLEQATVYERRLRFGQLCFLALIDGEIVGYNWTCFKTDMVPGRVIQLKEREIYTTDAYTAPKWRGHGIHTELNFVMLDAARIEGFETAYTMVNLVNTVSWVTLVRVGWEFLGAMLFVLPDSASLPRTWCVAGSIGPLIDIYAATRRSLERAT